MSIEYTKDRNATQELVKARWTVKKGTNGAPEILLDIHQGPRHICRMQAVMGSIHALKPLSKALLECFEKEAPNHSPIIQAGSQEYNTILKAL